MLDCLHGTFPTNCELTNASREVNSLDMFGGSVRMRARSGVQWAAQCLEPLRVLFCSVKVIGILA